MSSDHYIIEVEDWSIDQINDIIKFNQPIALSKLIEEKIKEGRAFLEDKLKRHDQPIYGINTGFGSLCNEEISASSLEQLQSNLVRSHACGAGERVDPYIVKVMMLLKVKNMTYGHSGVRLEVVHQLINMYNANILPVVYQQGSLGASGDLAPLAHMALAMMGEGDVYYNGEITPTEEAFKKEGLKGLQLQAKEGLALLNGTQFMSAHGVYSYLEGMRLWKMAHRIAALSLEAYDGRYEPFQSNVNRIRKQMGQVQSAAYMSMLIEGSPGYKRKKDHVQDPYSFRCIPQVLGATYDTLMYSKQILENEIGAVTDNPTIFPETDEVISAGNFHGQPLALVLDFLAIALVEMGNISERRTYKLVSGTRGLPAFLVANPGLNSGFMIPQYTAASIVSQNKQLATPSSIDSIDSSNGQEDHVSMGANAGTRLIRIIENLKTILGIECLNAAQAWDFRKEWGLSPQIESFYKSFRKKVDFIEEDQILYTKIEAARQFVVNYEIVDNKLI